MKWIALLFLLASIPVVPSILRSEKGQFWLPFVLGFVPFVYTYLHLSAALIAWPYWPGHGKGVIFSIADAIAIGVLFAKGPRRVRTPVRWTWWLYVFAAALAVPRAGVPMAALFYVTTLIRSAVIFEACLRLVQYRRGAQALIMGSGLGVIWQGIFALQQHFEGLIQAVGTIGHQNLLGLMLHPAIIPAVALIIVERSSWLPAITVPCGLMVALFTSSRATIGLAAGGVFAYILLSFFKNWTTKKATLLFLCFAVLAAGTPFALSAVQRRQQYNSTESSNAERTAFERAAELMIEDHPFGVGPNQYVVATNSQGYAARAGVSWQSGSRSTNVHNTYLLVHAETGFLGLYALLFFVGSVIFVGVRAAFKHRRLAQSELTLGATVALAVVFIHLRYEWVFVYAEVQYLIAMNAAVVAAFAWKMDNVERQRRRAARQRLRASTAEESTMPPTLPAPSSSPAVLLSQGS